MLIESIISTEAEIAGEKNCRRKLKIVHQTEREW